MLWCRIKNSFSGEVYMMAFHSLMAVESLFSACVKSLEFADIVLLVPWCDCKRTALLPKMEASHIA